VVDQALLDDFRAHVVKYFSAGTVHRAAQVMALCADLKMAGEDRVGNLAVVQLLHLPESEATMTDEFYLAGDTYWISLCRALDKEQDAISLEEHRDAFMWGFRFLMDIAKSEFN
jgi:hypothetical protein